MRILLVNQFFPPDLAPTGQMAADLAEDLVRMGHEVTVVASRGNYLGGDRHPTVSTWRGVQVARVAATSLGKRTLARRALDYGSFYASAGWVLRRLPAPDVLIAMTTPPLIAAACLGPRKLGTKLVYWIQDLYPEIAVAFGAIGENAIHTRTMAAVSRRVMHAAARIVVLGEAMKERVVRVGARRDQVSIIPNWADGDLVHPVARESNSLRDELSQGSRFVVLYSGNIGRAHDVETLIGATRKLSSRSDIAFVFQGEGHKRAELEAGTRGLPNARFVTYQPRERLAESLSAADVHLVTMSPNVVGLLEPSKLYGIMAAGRSAIYVGPAESEVARTISVERLGACLRNGDVDGLVEAIVRRASDSDLVTSEGRRARIACETAYGRQHRTAQFAEMVTALAKPREGQP